MMLKYRDVAPLNYRKLPFISSGLIQLRKGFKMGLYPKGLITGIKKTFRNELKLAIAC